MRARALSALLLLTGLTLSSALSCAPCEKAACVPADCAGRVVRDVCGCCDVCARGLDEPCGGHFDAFGLCDDGLVCQTSPEHGQPVVTAAKGVCIGEYNSPPPRRNLPLPRVLLNTASPERRQAGLLPARAPLTEIITGRRIVNWAALRPPVPCPPWPPCSVVLAGAVLWSQLAASGGGRKERRAGCGGFFHCGRLSPSVPWAGSQRAC